MNKYKKWNEMLTEYFRTATRKQLMEDSKKAGIILECKVCGGIGECNCPEEE
jgi:hypothetical protein